MLLPSDEARLILGYLQQEGLYATVQAFVLESPNLKEYSSHIRNHGVVPTCVFSLYGNNLSTILAEYVAAKATESCQEIEVPASKISLWEKLEVTLNQIKCLQSFLTPREDQICCEKAASGKEAESKTIKMGNMSGPKGSRRRKMARPLPRASRLSEVLTSMFPSSVSVLDTQSGTHPKAQSAMGSTAPDGQGQISSSQYVGAVRSIPVGSGAPGPLHLEAGGHPDPDKPRDSDDSTENPRNLASPFHQLGAQEDLCTPEGSGGQNHRFSESGTLADPNGPPTGGGVHRASGKSRVERVDAGQLLSCLQAAVLPSRKTSGTTGTRPDSTCSSTSDQPVSMCPLHRIKDTRPCGRETPPTPEGCLPVAPDAASPAIVTQAASATPPCLASQANPPGRKPEPCKIIAGGEEGDGMSASFQIKALSSTDHRVITGVGHQGATGTTVTASTLPVSPVQPTLQSIMNQKNLQKCTVVPSQISLSPNPSVKSPMKPNPRTEASLKGSTHDDSATERGPVASSRVGAPFGPGHQSPRRMLCFQVSDRNFNGAKISKVNLIGRYASGPTFWWMKPPVLEGPGAVGTSGVRIHPPVGLSLVCSQHTSEISSARPRPVAGVQRNIQKSSSPSPSQTPPPPRSPAQGCDPDRGSPPLHLLRDSASHCSTATRTLKVLSHSVVARTSTLPKSSNQQRATRARLGKRHLQCQLPPGPASMKELQLAANGTRVKRQKRLLDCFPDDVDVDKFLSCLHYDE